MRVEIHDVREIKEVSLNEDGSLHFSFPDYPGHIVKLVVLNSKSNIERSTANIIEVDTEDESFTNLDNNYIDGIRHSKGLPKTRKTAKEFAHYIQQRMTVVNRTLSWIILSSGTRIKYMNSVVYEKTNGYELWYSFSADELSQSMKDNSVYFAFLIRGSRNMIHIDAKNIIGDVSKAKKMRNNNDWTHLMILFRNGKLYIRLKTGMGNTPIEVEIPKEKYYSHWSDFVSTMEGVP